MTDLVVLALDTETGAEEMRDELVEMQKSISSCSAMQQLLSDGRMGM